MEKFVKKLHTIEYACNIAGNGNVQTIVDHAKILKEQELKTSDLIELTTVYTYKNLYNILYSIIIIWYHLFLISKEADIKTYSYK